MGNFKSKPNLVFLPGLLSDEMIWEKQTNDLSDIVEPITTDLTIDVTISDMADRILDQTPGQFILSALSMGGYVAFEILRKAPERVTAIALISTSSEPDNVARENERKAAISSLQHGQFKGVTDRFLPRLIHPSRINDPVACQMREMALRVGQNTFLRQQKAILMRPDYRPILEKIRVPTMIVVGDSDRLTPPDKSELIRDKLQATRFHILERCGHLPPLEHPEKLSFLMRGWLLKEVLATHP